jgi:hypothetical protein
LLLGHIAPVLFQKSGNRCFDLGLVYFVRGAGQEEEHDDAEAKRVPQLLVAAM